jgi:glutaredoxin
VLTAASGQAEIYRWIDDNGELQFGDRPPDADSAERVELAPGNHYSHREVALSEVESSPTAGGQPVVMYSARWCGVCKQARQYFRDHQVPFREYDVETSGKGRRDFRRLGGRGVPLILVGSRRMSGFSAGRFEQLYQE